MHTKELGSYVEGKATESKKASDGASNEQTHAASVGYWARSASQPVAFPVPGGQPARPTRFSQSHGPGAGNRMLHLQRRYGNRFVQRAVRDMRQREADEGSGSGPDATVPEGLTASGASPGDATGPPPKNAVPARRAHSGQPSRPLGMLDRRPGEGLSNLDCDLRSQAETQPQRRSREVAATAALHPQRTAKVEAHSASSDRRIQRAWYNFSIPFTDYEFDPSIEGIKTAAGVAKDAVVDSAAWVKDKVVAGFEWVFEKIKDLIGAGIDWLKGKYAEIKEFADSSFDSVRTGLSNLLAHITSPVSLITSAFNTMNADLLATAWNALRSGASLVWNGIKSVIDGVFKVGTGLWESASAFVTARFDDVESILDSWPFRQLPEVVQRKARELFGDIRSLWEEIRAFISDTLKRLRAFTDGIIKSVDSFVKKVISYAIQKVIDTVRAIKQAWEFVKKIADDPEGFVRPIIDQLVAKLNSEAPPKAIELGQEKLRENFKGGESSAAGGGIIQRQASTAKPKRSTASSEEADRGIIEAIKKAWASLDLGKMLWESFVNMFWPPATIRAIGHEFSELWSKDWASAAANFFTPRNILDDPAGFFHDVWSNVLILLDFPLALWRRLNNVFMLLLGYLTIILVIVGAVGGGIAGAAAGGVGAIPGALAGAWAGLELAGAIGLGLLASYFAAESISVIKLIVELRTARQTEEEKNRDYEQIAASLIGMAAAAVLVAILWLLSEFVAAIVRTVKAGRAGGAGVKPPAEEIKPVTEGKPAEAKPPSKEVKSPAEEVKPPAEEGKPPAETEAPEVVDGEPVVGKEPTGDGHEIKITEDGRIFVCTTCEEIQIKYAEELKGETPEIEAIKAELEQARKLPNGDEKAQAVEAVKEKLDKVRAEARQGETLEIKMERLDSELVQSRSAIETAKETFRTKEVGELRADPAVKKELARLEAEVDALGREWPQLKEKADSVNSQAKEPGVAEDPDLAKILKDDAEALREQIDDLRTKAEKIKQDLDERVRQHEENRLRQEQIRRAAEERAKEAEDAANNICDETDGTNRPEANIGDGSTEAVLREEIRTGKPIKSPEGHHIKADEAVRGLQSAVEDLNEVRPRIDDPARLKAIDDALARANDRIEKLQAALDEWNQRAQTHPDVFNPDGSSKVTPDWPRRPPPAAEEAPPAAEQAPPAAQEPPPAGEGG